MSGFAARRFAFAPLESVMAEQSIIISDRHLRAIGLIAVIWSGIEQAMEIAICGLYSIDLNRGLVLTANIGFRSRVDLLRILAKNGAIRDKRDAAICLGLLTRIEKAYVTRNEAVHGGWGPSPDPTKARRMSIRARGSQLRCVSEDVSAEELEASVQKIGILGADFTDLVDRLGLFPKPKG